MRWKGRRVSTNLEDRRGGGAKAGGISILGLIVAFVAWKFFWVDPQQAYQATQAVTNSQSSQQTSAPQNLTADQKEASDFVGTILADTEDTWAPIFQQLGMTYQPPRLVLFSGGVRSGCGTAQAAMGPFYCPAEALLHKGLKDNATLIELNS
ncbi:neutral zinc metallopeptidase, partial [Acinetobacter haemolyticus]